ncbi:unnamed protein product [Discula destructiva]
MASHPSSSSTISSSHSQHNGVTSKARLFLLASLAITWWIASLLPTYQPIIRAHFKSRLDEAVQKIPTIKIDWQPSDDPRAAYNASKTAMIIEPRAMPHLVPQLLHMIAVVPPDWRFLYIGSSESVTMLTRSTAVRHQQVIGKLDLMVLPEPWDVSSKEMVFRTLTDMRFYDEFLPGVEWILKYEYDSILCANSEVSLNEWLDWHWAGAPRSADDRFAGNGGLSLRRVSAIRKILGFQARYNDTTAEDEWFGERLWITPGLRVASGVDDALAVENVYKEKPMGYHVQEMGENLASEVWGNQEQRQQIIEYCPELYTVLNAKLDRERCPGDNGDGVLHPTPEEVQATLDQAAAIKDAQNKAAAQALQNQEDERRKKTEEDEKAAGGGAQTSRGSSSQTGSGNAAAEGETTEGQAAAREDADASTQDSSEEKSTMEEKAAEDEEPQEVNGPVHGFPSSNTDREV